MNGHGGISCIGAGAFHDIGLSVDVGDPADGIREN